MKCENKTFVCLTPALPAAGVVGRNLVEYERSDTVFTQGDASEDVLYIQRGGVRLSVVNESGNEAVVGILGPGDFFGESCLAGLPFRMSTATVIVNSALLVIEKSQMIRALQEERAFSNRFISYMLSRNIRVQEDLIDQLFNSTEKRLARTLLLLARYGEQDEPEKTLPKISQQVLADMIGTTRSRVNVFMTKFRRLGFIEYKDTIKINISLLNVVLND
jgi:CRP/FNR family cyclic AMP-dependent transcriptional regulator